MPREGSPFRGVAAVAMKEAADHMTNARFHLIMLLVLLTALGAIYGAIGRITATTAEEPFLFLRLLTVGREPLPSFVAFLGFLLPLVAIALGLDQPVAILAGGYGSDPGRAAGRLHEIDALSLDIDDIGAAADLRRQFLDGAKKADPAIAEERNAVTYRLNDIEHVGREQDRHAVAAELLDDGEQLLGRLRV